jgi:hypothetical protein
MPISLYCKNEKCPYNVKLEEPISFSFSAIYKPFEEDKCSGKCSIKPRFCAFYNIINDFVYEGAECGITQGNTVACDRLDCVHNHNEVCTRSELLIDRLNDHWVCKCFSFRKIRGHTDWSALLQGGVAKGGNIDDQLASTMHKDSLKFKSFGTWHKEGKIDTRKKAGHERTLY